MAIEGQARAKFLCDAERCIECNACVTACKNEHEVPWGINRRRVVTIEDGKPVFVKHAVKVKDGVKGQWLKCVKNVENLHSGFETSQFVPVTV